MGKSGSKAKAKPEPITAGTWVRFGLPKPREEYPVCSDRKWRVDFLWPGNEPMSWLAVEVHGGMWAGMGHATSPKDFAKGHRCTLNGWHRLEFTPQQVRSGYAPAVVQAWLDGGGWRASTLPPDPEDRRKSKKKARKEHSKESK